MDGTSVTEDILRPVTERGRTGFFLSAARLIDIIERGAVYSYTVQRRSTLQAAAEDIVNGCCAVVFDGPGEALTFEVRTKTAAPSPSPRWRRA